MGASSTIMPKWDNIASLEEFSAYKEIGNVFRVKNDWAEVSEVTKLG